MRQIGRIGLAVVLAVALFVAGGIGLLRATRREPQPAPAAGTSADAYAGLVVTSGSLDQAIAGLQARLRAVPQDWGAWANLGRAYVQQARITADPSYYPKAEGALSRSLALDTKGNWPAMVGMGTLALARHDFSGALVWGEKARAINAYNPAVYGVIGDAQIELGRYGDAFHTFQTMVDTRPDLSSLARVSYARELQGDVPGAIAAMQQAYDYGSSPNDQAWAANQLGELYFNSGRLNKAAEEYRRGTELAPSFVPPFAGLAKVAWARGDVDSAIARYADVVRRYPLPEYVIALGDLYRVSGRPDLAAQEDRLLHAEEQLFQANGVNIDLEIAVFDADHGNPTAALQAARAEWGRRHSVHVADALAWALSANGKYEAAATYSRFALHLGYRNALFLFHAGMIQRRLGNTGAARRLLSEAVATNPHFSILWSPVAERALKGLGG